MDTKYIGMDVHKETISIAVINAAGKLVIESIVETKAMTFCSLSKDSAEPCWSHLKKEPGPLVVRPSQALRHEGRGV